MYVRAPASAAPCSTESTECSPSASTISASSVPSATSLARYSTSDDCGVIGYTATISTRASATAQAAASLPSQTMKVGAFASGSSSGIMEPMRAWGRLQAASVTIVIARCGHSVAQMPQPLQVA